MTEINYWRCPACLATVATGATVCERCGEAVPEVDA